MIITANRVAHSSERVTCRDCARPQIDSRLRSGSCFAHTRFNSRLDSAISRRVRRTTSGMKQLVFSMTFRRLTAADVHDLAALEDHDAVPSPNQHLPNGRGRPNPATSFRHSYLDSYLPLPFLYSSLSGNRSVCRSAFRCRCR